MRAPVKAVDRVVGLLVNHLIRLKFSARRLAPSLSLAPRGRKERWTPKNVETAFMRGEGYGSGVNKTVSA